MPGRKDGLLVSPHETLEAAVSEMSFTLYERETLPAGQVRGQVSIRL